MIAVDTTINDTGLLKARITSDNLQGGAAAADAIAKASHDTGEVAVDNVAPGISTTDLRTEGFINEIKKYPKMSVVATEYNNDSATTAESQVRNLLLAHPSLVGVFATNLYGAQGAGTAISALGKSGKVYVAAYDAEPATVALPPLQGWRLVGIEKMSLLLREGELRVEAVLRHHSLFRVLIAAAATLFLGAWLVLLFEEHAKGSNIHGYSDALWWAIVTVTTVGYGDRFPVSEGGRAVAVILMLLGIGLIGVLTATVASVFVKEHTDANKEEFRKGHADLGQQLSEISDRLADVERRLGATSAEVAAVDAAADAESGTNEPSRPDQ